MNKPFYQRQAHRRGMLLLLVMLMLSLFMAIGAWLLTITLRSRASARAYGNSALATTGNDNLAKEALDTSLLRVLRGGTDGSVTSGTTAALENILADKYGSPLITGSGILQSATGTPLLTLSSTSPGIAGVANRLSGRVLTITPNANDGDTASFRILGATGTSGTATIHLANLPTTTIRKLPTGTSSFVINGRDFTPTTGTTGPESYDAYDDANLWLAQPLLELGQVSRFDRLSFSGTVGPAVVDNDNDGVLDGVWLPSDSMIATAMASGTNPGPSVIADRPSPLGGTLRFQVSYLILDLDGRININAAGMALPSPVAYPSDAAGPLGMGYGPADIDAAILFPPALPVSGTNKGSQFTGYASGTSLPFIGSGTAQFATTSLSGSIPRSGTTSLPTNLKWPRLLIAGTNTPANPDPGLHQRRAPVSIGTVIGRYAVDREPGLANVDDSDPFQTTTGTVGYSSTASGPNSFADLQGRRMVFVRPPAAGAITPTLVASSTVSDLISAALLEDAIDDPYETRLDGSSNNDATFSIAELERILRANDPDALQLPQRLAAGLEDAAQISRMTITTDSWDTPAITGLAARRIEDSLTNSSLAPPLIYSGTAWRSSTNVKSNPVSPDIAAGLRFNINRPVASGTSPAARAEQHEYCKGLYTLALLLSGTAANTPAFKERAAQWAVNVLDFRDADSDSTPFEYDRTINDGWDADSTVSADADADDEDEDDGDDDGDDDSGLAVVWGVEKPDFVITETAAWADVASGSSQLFVTIHRPAATVTLSTSSSPTIVSSTSALSLQGWQIRFDQNKSASKAVSLISGSTTMPNVSQRVAGQPSAFTTVVYSGSSVSSGLAASGSASYLCIHPVGPLNFMPSGVTTLQVSGTSFSLPPTVTSGTVTLERLLNPTVPNSATNPYIVVDRAPIKVIPLPPPGNKIDKKRRPGPDDVLASFPNNLTAFWRNPFTQKGASSNPAVSWEDGGAALGQYSINATKPVPWFHWPNRPFISAAELALVPSDDADSLLENYSFPSTSLVNSGTILTVSGTNTRFGELLLDAVHVPSRFAGNAVMVSGTAVNLFGLDLLQLSTSTNAQLSKWREPGKVNVNTIVGGITRTSGADATTDNAVWTTLLNNVFFANPFTPKPIVTETIPAVSAIPASTGNPTVPAIPAIPKGTPQEAAQPAASTFRMLTVGGTSATAIGFQDFSVSGTLAPRDRNPFFSYAQSIRLANTATIRSHVFAVWITVKITDDSPNAPSPVTKRMFAIIDRSIPVGYAPGQDLNVRDTIRLKRYLD